jgi:predicted patatin/cPLA2 family phospholipase
MNSNDKDIILIVGSGGMAGIFASGVLEAFEDERMRERVHSVYAVSVGGPIAARYLMRQSALGAQTFFTRFSDDRFLKPHFARYFFQAIRRAFFPNAPIDEIFNFTYFKEVILSSEDRIDMPGLVASPVPFFVKVFNNTMKTTEYLPVQEPYAYEKVLASASMTPVTSAIPVIDGVEYFDGDTIASDIDVRIAQEHPDKTIVYIVNSKPSFLQRINFLTPLVVYILFASLEGVEAGNRYLRANLKRSKFERKLRRQPNARTIASDLHTSSFCKDHAQLERAYQEGKVKGAEAVRTFL